ncbi:hypothetical protein WDW86_11300 [Bdellovibrionota bacterium FG-2]
MPLGKLRCQPLVAQVHPVWGAGVTPGLRRLADFGDDAGVTIGIETSTVERGELSTEAGRGVQGQRGDVVTQKVEIRE